MILPSSSFLKSFFDSTNCVIFPILEFNNCWLLLLTRQEFVQNNMDGSISGNILSFYKFQGPLEMNLVLDQITQIAQLISIIIRILFIFLGEISQNWRPFLKLTFLFLLFILRIILIFISIIIFTSNFFYFLRECDPSVQWLKFSSYWSGIVVFPPLILFFTQITIDKLWFLALFIHCWLFLFQNLDWIHSICKVKRFLLSNRCSHRHKASSFSGMRHDFFFNLSHSLFFCFF